jgi:hypothetical protein
MSGRQSNLRSTTQRDLLILLDGTVKLLRANYESSEQEAADLVIDFKEQIGDLKQQLQDTRTLSIEKDLERDKRIATLETQIAALERERGT